MLLRWFFFSAGDDSLLEGSRYLGYGNKFGAELGYRKLRGLNP